eukprot:8948868-Lingulodinium_polyedra.AAC.1
MRAGVDVSAAASVFFFVRALDPLLRMPESVPRVVFSQAYTDDIGVGLSVPRALAGLLASAGYSVLPLAWSAPLLRRGAGNSLGDPRTQP